MKTVFVLPKGWIGTSKNQEERLNSFQPFSLYSHTFLESKKSKNNMPPELVCEVGESDALVLWVLPKYMAHGTYVKYWPRVCDPGSASNYIQALCFADTWEDFLLLLKEYKSRVRRHETYISGQYEHPYTAMLDKWSKAGAKALHPGDYFKEDFLVELAKMKGSWVYFGHALEDRLRGYGHLLTKELCAHKPPQPLLSTLWFTCSTLASRTQKNVALSWYLSGATQSLLASPEAVKTDANQEFGKAWLACAQKNKKQSMAQVLLTLAHKSHSYKASLQQYCLLGNPWVLANLK